MQHFYEVFGGVESCGLGPLTQLTTHNSVHPNLHANPKVDDTSQKHVNMLLKHHLGYAPVQSKPLMK